MPNHAGAEKLIRRYYKAMNERDFDTVWGCFASDVVYTDAALGHVYRGLEEFKAFYFEYMLAPDVSLTMEAIVATDSAYGVTNHFSGKHAADLPGLPATGKSFSVASASIGTIENGRVKTNTDYWNMNALLTQLGVIGG
jgi:steroid delta-isomerase-like uncharacterized protein